MDSLHIWIADFVNWLVEIVNHFGIWGIFVMTFLESTFAPIPSEVTMIPAGYLVQQGKMDGLSVFAVSVLGTVGGAYFNYWIARRFGRSLFLRYGKYFFMTQKKLDKLERFFENHGAISTFTGRLIPGIRHYISFPAGLAKMALHKFFIYTALGGSIWMAVLLTLGYHIGENKELMIKYLPMIKFGLIGVVALLVMVYLVRHARATKASPSPDDK